MKPTRERLRTQARATTPLRESSRAAQLLMLGTLTPMWKIHAGWGEPLASGVSPSAASLGMSEGVPGCANGEKINAACLERLSPQDWKRLQAARDALERKEYSWAKFELDNVSEAGRAHPKILELSVSVYAGLQNHAKTIEVAKMLIDSGRAFDNVSVWLELADALHQAGREQEAYDTLNAFAARAGHIGLVHYRLAVYACLLGNPEAARAHFERALKTPEGARFRHDALADDRLRDIWEFLCTP